MGILPSVTIRCMTVPRRSAPDPRAPNRDGDRARRATPPERTCRAPARSPFGRARASATRIAGHVAQERAQQVEIERFGEVVIEAGFHRAALVLVLSPTGHRN